MKILITLKEKSAGKVLVVVAILGIVNAARSLEIDLLEPILSTGVDSGKTAEQLENERLAKLAARRAAIAKARARKGITRQGVHYSDGGTKDNEGKILVQKVPIFEVVGEKGVEITSNSQQEAIIAAGKSSGFFPTYGEEDHFFSSAESIERQLQNNQKSQQEIEVVLEKLKKEGITEQNNEHYEKLKVRYRSLQEQENVLKNTQDFLAFCKNNSSVPFTDSEVKELFIILDLPSLVEEDVKTMSLHDLWNLKGGQGEDQTTAKNTKGILQEKIELLTQKSEQSLEAAKKDGISQLTRLKKENPFESFLSKEQQKVLQKYLKEKLADIIKEVKKRAPVDDNEALEKTPEEQRGIDEGRRLQLSDLREKFKRLQDVFNAPLLNYKEYLWLKNAVGKIINSISDISGKGLSGESELLVKELQNEKEKVVFVLDQLPTSKMLTLEKITSTNVEVVVDALLTCAKTGVGFQKFISDRILKNLEISDLSIEQKQFLRKIVQQTEIFANLKGQAIQAVNAGNVVRMQELQDELRDFYEDVMRNTWKDEGLTKIDGDFLVGIRKSLNDLLQQFGNKASSFEGVVKNKKSVVAQVKYRFKRLWTRVKRAPKVIYRSELSANKKNFGLDLVDFKKTADEGYVKIVKGAIDSYKNIFTTTIAQEKSFSIKLNSDNGVVREEGKLERARLAQEVRKQLISAKVIKQQIEALKGVADCNGVLTYKKVEQALSLGFLPTTGDVFVSRLVSRGDGQSSNYKEVAYLLLEKNGSVEAQNIKENLENNSFLENDQKVFLSKLYENWKNGIKTKLKTGPDLFDLRSITLLQHPLLDSNYLAMVRSSETGQYVLDAYISKKDVVVPSAQAKIIVKSLKESSKTLDSFIVDAGRTLRRWKIV